MFFFLQIDHPTQNCLEMENEILKNEINKKGIQVISSYSQLKMFDYLNCLIFNVKKNKTKINNMI